MIYVAHMGEIAGRSEDPGTRDGHSHASAAGLRKPRLLILTPDFPPARGGIQTLVHRLAVGLSGFERRVIALDELGSEQFDATCPVTIRRVSAGGHLGPARNIPLNAVALREARRFRPQLTLCAHLVAAPAAAAIRRIGGARTVQYFYAKEVGAKPKLAAFAARQADHAIAISSYTAELVAASGISPDRLTLIPPGVDLPDAEPSSDRGPGDGGHPVFLTIARLTDRYKGHDVLIEALALVRAKVPRVEWVVIGEGPLRVELEALARSHGVADSVRFLGSVSDEERNSWLRRAELLAMPSRLPGGGLAGEGFGIVYLEAGARGKPVVAGNVAGAVDAVADGESGLLVDPADPHEVAEAITRLLLDRELARRLGRAGAKRAQGFAWPVIVRRVEAVLLETLARPPLSSPPRRWTHAGSGRTPA
jgi:phosphatidylinositol alpha-1,6-mannosyltransferase